MGKLLLVLLLLSLFFLSCGQSGSSSDAKGFAEISNSLERSNRVLQDDNSLCVRQLDKDSYGGRSNVLAGACLSTAVRIRQLSSGMMAHIDSIKQVIGALKAADAKSAEQVMERRGVVLYKELTAYTSNVLKRLDSIPNADTMTFSRQMTGRFGLATDTIAWVKSHWSDAVPGLVLAMLSKVQHDVLVSENSLLQYCLEKACAEAPNQYTIQPVAYLSNNYVKPKEMIEVHAGVGNLSLQAGKVLIVDGKRLPLDAQGLNTLTLPGGATGKHVVPMVLEYSWWDSTRIRVKDQLIYTVIP